MSNLRSLISKLRLPIGLALLLIVYLLTLPPSLTWAHHGADGGDLVTAVARGSIPHPPGFPTYLLLGELFIRLPFGNPAWRLNLMSAVLAAGAATLTSVAAGLCLQSPISNLQSLLCTGLSLGLAPLFWSQAIVAEVYAPAAFFTALVIVLALRGGPAWGLGLAWGIGIGAHPTLLLLIPLVAWGAWEKPGYVASGEAEVPSLKEKTWFLIQAILMALLGWGMMYGPVLLARGDVPSPWGDVSTLDGWWALISGRMYHGYLFGLPPTAWPQRMLAWVGLLARQFTPFGAMLAGLGWARLWVGWRSLALASALAFGAFSLYAISYNTVDSLVYLVLALPLTALWFGVGLAQAADWLSRQVRRSGWMILLLPLLQALLFWKQIDLSGDRTTMDWAKRTLQEVPPQAIILTAQDGHTFALWYVQDVLGERPDVAVIDVDLWAQEPYREMMGSLLGLGAIGGNLSPEAAACRVGRPIVEVTVVEMTNDK